MTKPLPPSFRQILEALRPVLARAAQAKLAHEIAATLIAYEMDLGDDAYCLQKLIIGRVIDAPIWDIELNLAHGLDIARAIRDQKGERK